MTEIPQYIRNHLAIGEQIIKGFQDGMQEDDTDNGMNFLQENAASAIKKLANAAVEFGTSLYNAIIACTKFTAEIISNLVHYVNVVYPKEISEFSSKRVVHLAAHAKKKRVRKKNYSRMVKNYYKNIGKKCYEKKGR